MTTSQYLYGEPATGKTRHANQIRIAFGLERIIELDGTNWNHFGSESEGVLYIGGREPPNDLKGCDALYIGDAVKASEEYHSQFHSPGKLDRLGPTLILFANGNRFFDLNGCQNAAANARRIVACWNACEDDDIQYLEGIVTLEHQTLRGLMQDALTLKERYQRELCEMETHRDLLRTACQAFVDKCDNGLAFSKQSYSHMKRAIKGEPEPK